MTAERVGRLVSGEEDLAKERPQRKLMSEDGYFGIRRCRIFFPKQP